MDLKTALGQADADFNYHWVKDNQIKTAVLEYGDTENLPDNVKAMPIVDNKLVEPTKWATETEGEDGTPLTGTHPDGDYCSYRFSS
jgi:hypothetical protein